VQRPDHGHPRTPCGRNPHGQREIRDVSPLQHGAGRLQRCRRVCVSV